MKIKICGLFREADIGYANEAMPDYIGFVFAPSCRQLTATQASAFRVRLREGITPVGVFVDAPVESIAALYKEGIIALAQLHGHEDTAYITALKRLCSVPLIKAVRIATGYNTQHALSMDAVDFFLFDNGAGGTGHTFDWGILSELTARLRKPYFLAGGINGDNITAALALKPFAVDVSSGVETNGVKDRTKMLSLVQQVRTWR
ncbi:MAG: phosphoribosylanthranilate isomerase [Treponema sp.]|jgi:phosphoribosylanthranilate isomerase|nr:phosphoribosylanthranilate isomerase [Treponema sp.]